VQLDSFGPSVESPFHLPVDAPAVRERTPARRSTPGGPRSARHDRTSDRRIALSSLAAELTAAAATIEDDVVFATVSPVALAPQATPAVELVLTGHPDAPAADHVAAVAEPATLAHDADAPRAEPQAEAPRDRLDALRTTARLEAARAEADVLITRVEAEQAARAEAERRLADAQDELRFLRDEVQMAGHKRPRQPGPLRRALRAVTGQRRPVVPANNPKKERLGV
jgi:hypothetical protein